MIPRTTLKVKVTRSDILVLQVKWPWSRVTYVEAMRVKVKGHKGQGQSKGYYISRLAHINVKFHFYNMYVEDSHVLQMDECVLLKIRNKH